MLYLIGAGFIYSLRNSQPNYFSFLIGKQYPKVIPVNLISVTKVTVTPDIATAKVYLSIFPTDNSDNIIKDIKEKAPMYRTMIAKTAAKNMRFAPELLFYLDVSLDKMEKIERALKGKGDNPIL